MCLLRFLDRSTCEVFVRTIPEPLNPNVSTPSCSHGQTLLLVATLDCSRFAFEQVVQDIFPFSFILDTADGLYVLTLLFTRRMHCYFAWLEEFLSTMQVEAPRVRRVTADTTDVDGFCVGSEWRE